MQPQTPSSIPLPGSGGYRNDPWSHPKRSIWAIPPGQLLAIRPATEESHSGPGDGTSPVRLGPSLTRHGPNKRCKNAPIAGRLVRVAPWPGQARTQATLERPPSNVFRGSFASRAVRVRTSHALGLEILRDAGARVEPLVDRMAVLRAIAPDLGPAGWRRLDTAFSRLKLDLGVTVDEVATDPEPGAIARAFLAY